MKKVLLILGMVLALALAGCGVSEQTEVDNPDTEAHDEMMENQAKFLHDGDTYTAELFVEMADTYEGVLAGEERQRYVFDLRDKADYNAGHIVGAINIDPETADFEAILEKTPSDYSVYVVGKTDEEAKEFVANLKSADEEKLFAYAILGGYEALEQTEGFDKYVSTKPGDFSDFTRTEAAKEFDELVEKGIIKEAE